MERRILKRDLIFAKDNIQCVLKSSLLVVTSSLHEFNSLGFSFSVDNDHYPVKCGDQFSAEIIQNGNTIAIISKVIIVATTMNRVSVRICHENDSQNIIERKNLRFELSLNAYLKTTFNNQVKFNDNIILSIVELSLDGGKAITSARNRTLLPGMNIPNAAINFSNCTLLTAINIAYIKPLTASDQLIVGLKFTNPSYDLKISIIDYLLKYAKKISPVDFMHLRKSVTNFKLVKDSIEYSIADSENEYNDVLKLRLHAYSRVGKVDKSLHWSQMSDEFDSRSIIILAKLRGCIIASGRLTFANKDKTFELEHSIQLPDNLKNMRERVCEVSRLCVDENFLSTNVIHGIFELGFQYCIKSETIWVISSTESKLIYLYKKIGFKISSEKFELTTLLGRPHHFMYAKVEDVIKGKMNLIAWIISFGKHTRIFK